MKSYAQKFLALTVAILILSSCASQPEHQTGTATVAIPTNTRTPRYSPVSVFTVTPLLSPPAILSATPAPAPSATPIRFIFDEEVQLNHPLSIERLRRLEYPGSVITFEQELEPGSNYRRYYVSYRSEGLKIYALMTIPDGEPPEDGWPVIIFNHGYIDPDVYRSTERYVEYVDEIATNGYIVFRSDYRGHGFSEGEARGAYGYPDYTIDVLNAVASMKEYEDANPDRIGMWGHSMGGYLTLRCMVITKDIKVGVIWAGVVAPYSDLVYEWPEQTYESPELANSWRTSLAATNGTPDENPAFWDAISANSYLTEISGPIQLQHGTGDVEVPVEFSMQLYRRLMSLGVPVELYTYENDNHNLSSSFGPAMRRTIQTFNLYLK